MYKLLKIKHLSVRSALPLALARTSIHRRWINFFLTSSNSYFDTPSFLITTNYEKNLSINHCGSIRHNFS